jgi:hypothetical protein
MAKKKIFFKSLNGYINDLFGGEHFFTLFSEVFSLFGLKKLICWQEDMKIKEKHSFLLPIQIQLLEIENPKNPKSDYPLLHSLSEKKWPFSLYRHTVWALK